MAESQRSAFAANLSQLAAAKSADDDGAGLEAALGIARLLFFQLDRIADALEVIAQHNPVTAKSLSEMRFR